MATNLIFSFGPRPMLSRKQSLNLFDKIGGSKCWRCGTPFSKEWTFISQTEFDRTTFEAEKRFISFVNAFGSEMDPQRYSKHTAFEIAESYWKLHRDDLNFVDQFISNPKDLNCDEGRIVVQNPRTAALRSFIHSMDRMSGRISRGLQRMDPRETFSFKTHRRFAGLRKSFRRLSFRQQEQLNSLYLASIQKASPEEKKDFRSLYFASLAKVQSTSSQALESYPMEEMMDESDFLEMDIVMQIQGMLPEAIQGSNWVLCYSLLRDGVCYDSFLQKVQEEERLVLFIHTFDDEIFGCFTSSPWEKNPDYFGNGESWVFNVSQPPQISQDAKVDSVDFVRRWKWTGKNDYFMHCTESSIGMGGGGEGFSFLIGDDMNEGTTAQSDTYDNEPLTSNSTFRVANVEAWGFRYIP